MTADPTFEGSRDGSVDLDWADGHYTFRLGWGELEKLQEACGAGPWMIHARLASGAWKLADIRETIRLALIGGGLAPDKALRLVRDYVESRPPLETLMLARGILSVALMGPGDEPLGEAAAATGSAENG